MHKVQIIAINDPGCLLVCESVCHAALLNSAEQIEQHCTRWEGSPDYPYEFDAAFAKLLWLLVYCCRQLLAI